MEIVHITFEKLTGLKGTIEGYFIADPENINVKLPIIYEPELCFGFPFLTFSQLGTNITIRPAVMSDLEDYKEHFERGTNFLIKELRYGGGRIQTASQSPN